MAQRLDNQRFRRPRWAFIVCGWSLLVLPGCQNGEGPGVELATNPATPANAPGNTTASATTSPAITDKPAATSTTNSQDPAPKIHRWNQPFTSACLTTEIPDGQQPPVDLTHTGLPTAKVRLAVEAQWSNVGFEIVDGKAKPILLEWQFQEGLVQIELNPNLAPNHVRNIIALTQVGYYKGMKLDRVSETLPESGEAATLLHFGCPAGLGESGLGHLGYFLKPESSEEARHLTGTVGVYREEDVNSACCRLYINLQAAPHMDGNYAVVGKVTKGMDVLQKLARTEKLSKEDYPRKEIPAQPIRIQDARTINQK